MYREVGNRIPLIGCGGILTPEQAYKKIKLGASIVQIYSGFILSGPKLIYDINKYIDKELEKENKNINDIIGTESIPY